MGWAAWCSSKDEFHSWVYSTGGRIACRDTRQQHNRQGRQGSRQAGACKKAPVTSYSPARYCPPTTCRRRWLRRRSNSTARRVCGREGARPSDQCKCQQRDEPARPPVFVDPSPRCKSIDRGKAVLPAETSSVYALTKQTHLPKPSILTWHRSPTSQHLAVTDASKRLR